MHTEPTETEEVAERGDAGPVHLWLLVASLVTVIALLCVITITKAWDPYVCESNDECRGLKQCIEGYCVSPEVWERRQQRGE